MYLFNPKSRFNAIFFAFSIAATLLAATWSKYGFRFGQGSNGRNTTKSGKGFTCQDQKYATEIVSVDPLVIWIEDFVSTSEADEVIAVGAPDLETSEVYIAGVKRPNSSRTSKSAGLHKSHPIISCVLSRAGGFMGSLLSYKNPKGDFVQGDFGTPQLVQYSTGERFDVHHDWYDEPQVVRDGTQSPERVFFNRVASFFVYLEAENVTAGTGETWFPELEYKAGRDASRWRKHEEGGTAFVPKKGSALFWVNLDKDGKGDDRVVHAGLPLGGGRKTAMNIWPRVFYGREGRGGR